jgi:hypothetical protein
MAISLRAFPSLSNQIPIKAWYTGAKFLREKGDLDYAYSGG